MPNREGAVIPEVGFGLVTHGQGFLFRHDEHSRGTVGLRKHRRAVWFRVHTANKRLKIKHFQGS